MLFQRTRVQNHDVLWHAVLIPKRKNRKRKKPEAMKHRNNNANTWGYNGLPLNKTLFDPCIDLRSFYLRYSSTPREISSRKETNPMMLERSLPSMLCSSMRYFSNAVASSCPPRMNVSFGVIFLSCFNLLIVARRRPETCYVIRSGC